MLLLTGPPAAGKTRFCIAELRKSLSERTFDCRLLVPTSTMAEHLRNELAREGLVFPPRAVSTFGKFIADYAVDLPGVSTAALELLVREQLQSLPLRRYHEVRDFPGFRSALVRAVEEFSGAGGSTEHAALVDPEFAAIWHAVEQRVSAAGRYFRAARLRIAAERIRQGPTFGKIWITGFFGFTPPELDVLEALDARSTLTVTLTESPAALAAAAGIRSIAAQEKQLPGTSTTVERVLVTTVTADDEANEIARRVLTERERGREFRDLGVIVRAEQPSVPALTAAFDRFGIPWRSYFAPALRSDPTVRYLLGLTDTALNDWDHEAAVATLRMHGSPLEQWGDQFEYSVLEHLPGRGLDSLRRHAPEFAHDFFARLATLSSWTSDVAEASVWASRFASLPDLFRPTAIDDRVPHNHALLWRTQSASTEHFLATVEETATFLGHRGKISCRDFRSALEAAISSVSVRVVDRRRDVVHIFDAVEARQWRLPVVFLCGLLQQDFPRRHSEDPILGDETRRRLQEAGLPLKTTAERQSEEEFLFDLALTRGTERLVLSYAHLNAKGEPNLPSFLLERAEPYLTESAVAIKPEPLRSRAAEPSPAIVEEDLRAAIASRHNTLSATKVERYIACPYSFFAERTLRLKQRPDAPWDRLNSLVQGTIGHAVFELVFREGIPAVEAFNSIFRRICEEARIPDGYRTEAIRLELLHGVEQVIRDKRLAPRWNTSFFEKEFTVELNGDLRVTGRIDRLDVDPHDQAIIIDYKYKRKYRIDDTVTENENGKRVQTGLYLLGASSLGLKPAGMLYAGFKRESSVNGWVLQGLLPGFTSACSPEHIQNIISTAREVTLTAHFGILQGRIRPQPAEERTCEFCSFNTMCRVESAVAERVEPADAAQ